MGHSFLLLLLVDCLNKKITMSVPLIASSALLGVSTFFAYQTSEHLLKSKFGPAVYQSSYYIRDLSVYASITSFFLCVYFIGSTILNPATTNVIFLTAVSTSAYFLTFRSILMTVFSNRFKNILKQRYNFTENLPFDGATSRCHAGGIPSYVANYLITQMDLSNKVAFPVGFVWSVFVFICLSYAPPAWIEGLVLSGVVALYAAIGFTIVLLPETNDDKPIPSWRASPISNLLPAGIFLSLFTFLTPVFCQIIQADLISLL